MVTAIYSGASNFEVSSSLPRLQSVRKLPTSITLSSSPSPSTFGQMVTLTATVTATTGTPTGSVIFRRGTTLLGTRSLVGGVARFTIATLGVGNHSISAVYGGTARFAASVSPARSHSVESVVFNGGATLVSLTAACPANLGLSVGDLATSVYRPRLAADGGPQTALTFTFERSAFWLYRTSGADQMNGAGNYAGRWISERVGVAPVSGTYNFVISPVPVLAATRSLTIDGVIGRFANVPGCSVRFRGNYDRRPN
jgi:hypothetical protein